MTDFVGAKVALLCGDRILTYQRDTRPGLPWPGLWDLPGGGRECSETAEQCLIREVWEEFGLHLDPRHLLWRNEFPAMQNPAKRSVFFAGRISAQQVAEIRFGTEGQRWQMMTLSEWLNHPSAIPALQHRTALALGGLAQNTA